MRDYEYLINLLYSFIHGEAPTEKPEEVSFENVYLLAKAHEVANIAFLSVEKLKEKPEPALYDEWKLNYYFSIERDSRQKLERERVVSEFHSRGIRTLEAQGTVTKKLYPEEYLRMMTDIDFVIDKENTDKVMEALSDLGYTVTVLQDGEFYADRDGLELDFHTAFFSEFMFNRKERYSLALSSPFEHAEESADESLTFYLTDDYFYLYSVIHIIKHFETAGCGIRRILDLYYLSKAYEDRVDNGLINSVIDENNLRESYEKLFALERLWFEGVESTLDLGETVRDVVTSGNHGNEEIFTRNNVRKDIEKGIRFARLKRVYGFFFPSYKYINIEFPECEERGYSLFRARLYRIVKKLKRLRFSHAVKHIKEILKSK